MAEFKIEVSGDDINKAMADAIVKSLLGDTIVKMVEEYVKGLSNAYSNPVKKIIEEEVKLIITKVIEERKYIIQEAVKNQLTPELANKVISEMIAKVLR